jgi:small conductance mechanosensitive channel
MKLSFSIPFEQAHAVIKKTLNERTDLLKEPELSVGVSSIDPDGYKMMTNVWVEAHSFQKIRLELQECIVKDLISAGLKLPGL